MTRRVIYMDISHIIMVRDLSTMLLCYFVRFTRWGHYHLHPGGGTPICWSTGWAALILTYPPSSITLRKKINPILWFQEKKSTHYYTFIAYNRTFVSNIIVFWNARDHSRTMFLHKSTFLTTLPLTHSILGIIRRLMTMH